MDVAAGLGTMILNTPLVYGVYCAPPFHISVILDDIHISVESREFLSKSMRPFRIFIEININIIRLCKWHAMISVNMWPIKCVYGARPGKKKNIYTRPGKKKNKSVSEEF